MAVGDGSEPVGTKYQDFSGVPTTQHQSDNPYETLIEACHGDPEEIQARYEAHRRARNEQQRERLLSPHFKGVDVDPILYKLLRPDDFPSFLDTRNCLVFWARPTESVKKLIGIVQQKLQTVLPNLWLMPAENLHMTAMEVAHSKTAGEIEALVTKLQPLIEDITDFTYNHRARLVRPLLGFDASAFALSFVPTKFSREGHNNSAYSYHHLRRDLHEMCKDATVKIESRYVVPSAHLTIGRFVTQVDISQGGDAASLPDPQKMKKIVACIDAINAWLQESYWEEDEIARSDGREWIVGQANGLDCGRGTLWYGCAQRVRLGRGF